ncbi:MAG: flagellar motor protein MotB [Desulfosarcinaceae bacterium]
MAAPAEECPPCEKGAPMWVTTFGDLMSLLLCFFVLLLSFSEMDRAKYKQVAGSMEKAFGVQRRTRVMESPKGIKMIAKDFDQEAIATRLKEEIGRELEEAFKNDLYAVRDQLDVGLEQDNLVIRMMGESTFDSGSADIRSATRPLLIKIGKIIAKANKDIVIAGHTDNVPIHRGRGPYTSNLRRAAAGQLRHRSRPPVHHGLRRIPPHRRQPHCGRTSEKPPRGDHRGEYSQDARSVRLALIR